MGTFKIDDVHNLQAIDRGAMKENTLHYYFYFVEDTSLMARVMPVSNNLCMSNSPWHEAGEYTPPDRVISLDCRARTKPDSTNIRA